MAELGWNPWRALRERPWLTLRTGTLPGGAVGMLVAGPDRPVAVVWLDRHLGRRDRRATLAHELVHDERGLFYDGSTPMGLILKEEALVERETVRRLVPDAALAELATADLPVELWEVAERFDVPEDLARAAVARFVSRR